MKTQKNFYSSVIYQRLTAIAIQAGVTVGYRDGRLSLRDVQRLGGGGIFAGTVELDDGKLQVHFADADDGPVSNDEINFYFSVLASMFEIAYEADADVAQLQIPRVIAHDADGLWEFLRVALEVLTVLRAYAEDIALGRMIAAQEPPVLQSDGEALDFELEATFEEAEMLV